MPDSPFPMLQDEEYMSLTTYRKSGKPVPTPVWFAERDAALYVMTLKDYGKVKRLRHTAEVEIAPCDMRGNITGESMTAHATLHDKASDIGQLANTALNKKYGWKKKIFDVLYYILPGKERIYIKITPD